MKTNFMKVSTWAMALCAAMAVFTACNDDEDGTTPPPAPSVENLGGIVTENMTLTANTEYKLTSQLQVKAPAVLTIEEGVKITAADSEDPIYILIEQGAKINAVGTVENPIVMTAENKTAGGWGGLHICGYAPTNAGSGFSEIGNAAYGGNDANDNSGVLKYVRLEYTGFALDDEHESNGISFYGVGAGTQVSYVQTYVGADDGLEFFGGTVNVTNLLAVNPDDDMFDFTQGYSGKLKNCYGVWESGYTSTEADPRGIEADGNLDGIYPDHLRQSDFAVENMTIVNNAANTTDNVDRMQDVIKIRRGAKATITNALVKGSGGTVDLIDMNDSKGAGSASSSISITHTLNFKNKLNGTLNTFTEPTTNTGADASLFTWTGYNISSLY